MHNYRAGLEKGGTGVIDSSPALTLEKLARSLTRNFLLSRYFEHGRESIKLRVLKPAIFRRDDKHEYCLAGWWRATVMWLSGRGDDDDDDDDGERVRPGL